MLAPTASALLPTRVLFVTDSESSVSADMAALRGLGVTSFALCADPEQVPAVLAEAPADRPFELLICPHRSRDDTAERLLRRLAGAATLARFPVLIPTGEASRAAPLEAAGAKLLERPYSPNDLAAALQRALSPLRRSLSAPAGGDKSRKAAAKLERPMTTGDLVQAGHRHLEAGRTAQAAKAFAAALQRIEDLPEACLGMARLERRQDNPEEAHRWVVRAAAGYLRRNDDAGLAALLPHLPKGTRGLFAEEASTLMDQGRHRQACCSFLEAAQESGEPLHAIIARACAFSNSPSRRMEILCDAFEASGHAATAKSLRLRLLRGEYVPVPARPGWLHRFPRLQEVVAVAGWTAQAWKHG